MKFLQKLFLIPTILALIILNNCIGSSTQPKKNYRWRGRGSPSNKKLILVRKIKGLRADSLSEMLNLPDDEIDLGKAALLIAKMEYPQLDVEKYLGILDQMQSELWVEVANHKRKKKKITAFNNYIFNKKGFRVDYKDPFGENPKNLYLNDVIDRKKGYCLSLAVLYLALAERLNMPFYGCRLRNHFIVRYIDETLTKNIETTMNGYSYLNKYYIKKNRIPEVTYLNKTYLSELSKKNVIATILGNRAALLQKEGKLAQALKIVNLAIDVDPNFPTLIYNRGVIERTSGDLKKAYKDFRQVIKLDPNHFYAYTGLGILFAKKKETEKAIEYFLRSIAINHKYADNYRCLGMIYLENKKSKMAIEYLKKYLKYTKDVIDKKKIGKLLEELRKNTEEK